MKDTFGKTEAKPLKLYRAWLKNELEITAPRKASSLVGGKALPDFAEWAG
jgi:hypothetical protein